MSDDPNPEKPAARREEAILAILDQLEVTESNAGDIELLKALVQGKSIEAYALGIYSKKEEDPAKSKKTK